MRKEKNWVFRLLGNIREKKADSLIHSAVTASTGSANGAVRASRESLSPLSAWCSLAALGLETEAWSDVRPPGLQPVWKG